MSKNPHTTNPSKWQARGQRLRVMRIMNGWTEAEAAKKCGVTLRTYRGWEAGRPPKNQDFYVVFGCGLGLRRRSERDVFETPNSPVAIFRPRSTPRQRSGDTFCDIVALLPPDRRTALNILRRVTEIID